MRREKPRDADGNRLEERVVKRCLRASLALQGDQLATALDTLDELVANVSKLVHHGSMLLNHYVAAELAAGRDVPGDTLGDQMLCYAAMSVVTGGTRTKYPGLLAFYNEKRHLYPGDLRRLAGDSPMINAAALKLKTNICNHLRLNLRGRLLRHLRSAFPEATRPQVAAMTWRAMGMTQYLSGVELDDSQRVAVAELRLLLLGDSEEAATDAWIDRNRGRVLAFTATILRRIADAGGRRYSLLPVASRKRHFVAISGDILRALMVRTGLLDSAVDQKTFNILADDHRRSFFRVRGSWRLGDTIETDGVAICFHIRKRRSDPEDPTPRKRRRTVAPSVFEGRVIGNDPGRANIASTVEILPDGSARRCRLTRRRFYRESGAGPRALEKERVDRRAIGPVLLSLSETTYHTADVQEMEGYLAKSLTSDAVMWKHRLARSAARRAMDVWIGKRRTLDRFWKRDVCAEGATIAYGNAGFASSGRGEKAVPTTEASKAAARFAARVVWVDEYCTTKCCCACGTVLSGVRSRTGDKLRGLLRCGSNVCRGAPLKSRDWNAATNMLFKLRPPQGGCVWLQRPSSTNSGAIAGCELRPTDGVFPIRPVF
jgi:hypothetical protein